MKKKLAILVAATLLVLVLAIPASASKSFPIEGTAYTYNYEDFSATQVGPLCLVTSVEDQIWEGSIAGTGTYHYRSLSNGAADCDLGPIYDETYHLEGVIDAIVMGRQGTISYKCQGQHYAGERNVWEGHCVVLRATDGLKGFHATWDVQMPITTWVDEYQGEAHFDPDE
jgi:hypothetical protein